LLIIKEDEKMGHEISEMGHDFFRILTVFSKKNGTFAKCLSEVLGQGEIFVRIKN
jgi:hypothetical protein